MYTDPLHVAYIRSNEWMHAIELQVNRILGTATTSPDTNKREYRLEWNQKQHDIDFFLIALRRLKFSIDAVNKQWSNEAVAQALESFAVTVPDAVDLRDIGEHLDEYDWGKGKLQIAGKLTSQSPSKSWGQVDGGISYGGKNLSIVEAREAARKLHKVVMQELNVAGRDIELTQWPLVQDFWGRNS